VEKGFRDVVEFLLAHGADPSHPTDAGATPLELAAGQEEMLVLLRGHEDGEEGGEERQEEEEGHNKAGGT